VLAWVLPWQRVWAAFISSDKRLFLPSPYVFLLFSNYPVTVKCGNGRVTPQVSSAHTDTSEYAQATNSACVLAAGSSQQKEKWAWKVDFEDGIEFNTSFQFQRWDGGSVGSWQEDARRRPWVKLLLRPASWAARGNAVQLKMEFRGRLSV